MNKSISFVVLPEGKSLICCFGVMLMNKKRFLLYLAVCLIFLLFFIAVSYEDEILEIEEKNAYSWQKYMNEDEYNQLKKDMSYIDVVQIVGGAGEKVDADTLGMKSYT